MVSTLEPRAADGRAHSGERAADGPRRIHLGHGASATLHGEAGAEAIALHDPAGRLVVEYDPTSGRTVICVPAGDLEIRAPEGAIRLESRDGVSMRSDAAVLIEGRRGVALAARGATPSSSPQVALQGDTLRLSGARLAVAAEDASLSVRRASYAGDELATRVEHARAEFGTIETVATRITERAREAFRAIEGLQSFTFGRVRTLVRSAFDLRCERAHLRGARGVKIAGDRIDLG
jgi:hypothetical protein